MVLIVFGDIGPLKGRKSTEKAEKIRQIMYNFIQVTVQNWLKPHLFGFLYDLVLLAGLWKNGGGGGMRRGGLDRLSVRRAAR